MNFEHKDENTALIIKAGSHAYGMNTPQSDIDLRGIVCAPKEILLSPFQRFEQDTNPDFSTAPKVDAQIKLATNNEKDLDFVVYDLSKALKLISECNPNMLEIPWIDEKNIVWCNKVGEKIIEYKKEFLTTRAKHRFSGYATSQLNKIKRHRSWLLNPPKKKPEREDFGLPKDQSLLSEKEYNIINEDIKNTIRSWLLHDIDHIDVGLRDTIQEKVRSYYCSLSNCGDSDLELKMSDVAVNRIGLSEEVRQAINAEKKYRNALTHWKSYLSWKENRNKERKKMEEESGFDLKHASHLIRLQRMSCEILEFGEVRVHRDDAEELLAIRRGARTYESIVEEANALEERSNELLKLNPCNLPKTQNMKKIEQFYFSLI